MAKTVHMCLSNPHELEHQATLIERQYTETKIAKNSPHLSP